MNKLFAIFVTFLFLSACSKDSAIPDNTNLIVPVIPNTEIKAIKGVDISFLPEIEETATVFYNSKGEPEDVLTTLKNNGVNTIRIRLWKNPTDKHSGFDEVKTFAERVKNKGFKVWLTVHYSDTWADPGAQVTPKNWRGLSINQLKDSVYSYTKKIVVEIKPDFIQIGNEINPGFLLPQGDIKNENFVPLLAQGIKAVREFAPKTKIMIHYAGFENATYLFEKVKTLDYDLIGLSYYPIWHGKDINALKTALINLSTYYNKKIVLAETAYPFTLGWNDLTNNNVGINEQLITDFPATEMGQKMFLTKLRNTIESVPQGFGFCYWGAEWISFKGAEAKNGSSWENQALYDFNKKALPAMEVFKD